jgi:hypothetical protein
MKKKGAAKEETGTLDCLKELDFYKYLPHGLAQPSMVGALTSTGFIVFMAVILFYQIIEFISHQKDSEVLIDFNLDD